MNKVIKIIVFSLALICALVPFSFSVFAAKTDYSSNFSLGKTYIRDTDGEWYDMSQYTTWDPSTFQFKVLRSSSIDETYAHLYYGLRTTWNVAPFLKVDPGYYLVFEMTYQDEYTTTSTSNPDSFNFSLDIELSDSTSFLINPTYIEYTQVQGMDRYILTFITRVGGDYEVRIKNVTFETNAPSFNVGKTSYSAFVHFYLDQELTLEQKNHQEVITTIQGSTQDIIDNANDNADKITGAIDDQTEELTHGWENSENPSGDIDDLTGNLEEAENAALGNKSDSEIQQEVSAALDTSKFPSPNSNGAVAVASTFDSLLEAFGDEYQSLLILALTLGLAAYLVGKSYRAKGD